MNSDNIHSTPDQGGSQEGRPRQGRRMLLIDSLRKRRDGSSYVRTQVTKRYQVNKVLNARKRKGRRFFLVRWQGYPYNEDSWEPETVICCPELITQYNEEKAKAQREKRRIYSQKRRLLAKQAKEAAKAEAARAEAAKAEAARAEAASAEAGSDDSASEEATSDGATSDEVANDEAVSDEAASEEAASDEETSDEEAGDEEASDEAASDEAASDVAASDEEASDESANVAPPKKEPVPLPVGIVKPCQEPNTEDENPESVAETPPVQTMITNPCQELMTQIGGRRVAGTAKPTAIVKPYRVWEDEAFNTTTPPPSPDASEASAEYVVRRFTRRNPDPDMGTYTLPTVSRRRRGHNGQR